MPKEISSLDDLTSSILGQAIRERASDIHIDPNSQDVSIRFRIDGALQKKYTIPTYKLEPFLNRIKILANLDISTHVAPQDGGFETDIVLPKTDKFPEETRRAAGRISLFTTINGEAAVIRILNRSEMLIPLEKTDMNQDMIAKCRRLFSKNYGMVPVTGPSGSGKTALLYTALKEITSEDKNIITLEDPVEYRFDGVRQIQIQPDQGLTFAAGMKSILRQDPDVIMIGEIRDPETAAYAIRASLIGRLVLSTIHANTSLGTIARLIDMNIERSLIAYALTGVIAKRLVRKICSSCAKPYEPDPSTLKYFGIEGAQFEHKKGTGCEVCSHTGYFDRVGIFEVLELDTPIRSLILDKAPMSALEEYIEKMGITTLKQDALNKIFAGLITVEDAARTV